MAPSYTTLCTTYESIAVAVATLSTASILIIDCEARDIAHTTGVLSILSISDVDARSVFLIDALALQDPSHPAFKPLFDLLESEAVMKLMWDGRSDACELRETYGVQLRGVLDLQLAEVVSRQSVRGETEGTRKHRLSSGYFKRMKKDIRHNPAEFEGIHHIMGMDTCLKARGINDSKDAAVVALHKTTDNPDMWLERPLPHMLLNYAAHDLELIAKLYVNFVRAGWINERNIPLLKQQSARYLSTFRTRAVKDLFDKRSLGIFVPLHVLAASSAKARRFECEGCRQKLVLRCYPTIRWDQGRTQRRLTFCKLCAALAKRNLEASRGDWIAVR